MSIRTLPRSLKASVTVAAWLQTGPERVDHLAMATGDGRASSDAAEEGNRERRKAVARSMLDDRTTNEARVVVVEFEARRISARPSDDLASCPPSIGLG